MKLRIQGNSLRLRLTRPEVAQLHEHGQVASTLQFAPGVALVYVVESSGRSRSVGATFDGRTISVHVPGSAVAEWASSDQVGIEGPTQNGGLRILIEKDFQCLHKDDARDPDAYPNPLKT